jgi:hypothetical protein
MTEIDEAPAPVLPRNRAHLVQAWEYDWPPARWQRYLRAQLDGAYSRP